MEWLNSVKDIVQTLGSVGTLGALIILGIFLTRPQVLDRLPFFKKKETTTALTAAVVSNDPTVMRILEDLSGAMEKLQAHFNDETTAVLTDIQTTLVTMRDLLEQLVVAAGEHSKALELIKQRQHEMLKYGVPERKTSISIE